jgi:Tfp pilus assembly protein PilF
MTLPIYQNANNTTKLLFEAAILHQKELFNQAKSKYDTALKSAPDNSLAKMMYSFFCNELGEIESAAETLEK